MSSLGRLDPTLRPRRLTPCECPLPLSPPLSPTHKWAQETLTDVGEISKYSDDQRPEAVDEEGDWEVRLPTHAG